MEYNIPSPGGSALGGKYFFVLGSNPTLSIAELNTVFGFREKTFLAGINNILVIDNLIIKDPRETIGKLGGTIKIGRVSAEIPNYDTKKILTAASDLIGNDKKNGKFNFGFSYYGNRKINIKVLGMELKKILRDLGVNSRWVTSREPALSSVVVEQNKLVGDGLEICLIQNGDNLLVGKTLAVQPFKELSFRDYGRPARDDLSGMLPPKLAQIMINLAVFPSPVETQDLASLHDMTILDPFCGSGTILTEAMLMGHKNLIGSDISIKAVQDTNKNIEWTAAKFQITNFKLRMYNQSSLNISNSIDENSIDAIVTEPYLGPQRGRVDLGKIIKELERLYSDSLKEFYKLLKPNGRIVMIWPVFRGTNYNTSVNPDLNGFQITYPLPEKLKKYELKNLSTRNTIIYGRTSQEVWREIVILNKK